MPFGTSSDSNLYTTLIPSSIPASMVAATLALCSPASQVAIAPIMDSSDSEDITRVPFMPLLTSVALSAPQVGLPDCTPSPSSNDTGKFGLTLLAYPTVSEGLLAFKYLIETRMSTMTNAFRVFYAMPASLEPQLRRDLNPSSSSLYHAALTARTGYVVDNLQASLRTPTGQRPRYTQCEPIFPGCGMVIARPATDSSDWVHDLANAMDRNTERLKTIIRSGPFECYVVWARDTPFLITKMKKFSPAAVSFDFPLPPSRVPLSYSYSIRS